MKTKSSKRENEVTEYIFLREKSMVNQISVWFKKYVGVGNTENYDIMVYRVYVYTFLPKKRICIIIYIKFKFKKMNT